MQHRCDDIRPVHAGDSWTMTRWHMTLWHKLSTRWPNDQMTKTHNDTMTTTPTIRAWIDLYKAYSIAYREENDISGVLTLTLFFFYSTHIKFYHITQIYCKTLPVNTRRSDIQLAKQRCQNICRSFEVYKHDRSCLFVWNINTDCPSTPTSKTIRVCNVQYIKHKEFRTHTHTNNDNKSKKIYNSVMLIVKAVLPVC